MDVIAARASDLTLDHGDWLIREGDLAAFFPLLRTAAGYLVEE